MCNKFIAFITSSVSKVKLKIILLILAPAIPISIGVMTKNNNCTKDILNVISLINYNNFITWLITINTILMAGVVFCYSIQDNKKIGVSYRTIMMCSFGSLAVPYTFSLCMILIPVIYILEELHHYTWVRVSIIVVLYWQIMTLSMIMLSSSTSFGIHGIIHSITSSYNNLQKDRKAGNNIDWLYCSHLQMISVSDDLFSIKLDFFKKYIRIPFDEKHRLDIRCDHKLLYGFYYDNLYMLFLDAEKNFTLPEQRILYRELYLCLNVWGEKWLHSTDCNSQVRSITAMTGILNAAISSGKSESEDFWLATLLHLIKSEQSEQKVKQDLFEELIILYLLFLEFSYRFLLYENVKTIKRIHELPVDVKKIQRRIRDKRALNDIESVWATWVAQVHGLESRDSYRYLYNAINTIAMFFSGSPKAQETSFIIRYVLEKMCGRNRNYGCKDSTAD